jgi:hypothetical protein
MPQETSPRTHRVPFSSRSLFFLSSQFCNFIQNTIPTLPHSLEITPFNAVKMFASSRVSGAVARMAAKQPLRLMSTTTKGQGTFSVLHRRVGQLSASPDALFTKIDLANL